MRTIDFMNQAASDELRAASDYALIRLADHFYEQWRGACQRANDYGFDLEPDTLWEEIQCVNNAYWDTVNAMPPHLKADYTPPMSYFRLDWEELSPDIEGRWYQRGYDYTFDLYSARRYFLQLIRTGDGTPTARWIDLINDLTTDGRVEVNFSRPGHDSINFAFHLGHN